MLEETSNHIRVRIAWILLALKFCRFKKESFYVNLHYSLRLFAFTCALCYILRYVQMLDSTFTYASFVLLILNVMIMSVIGLQVTEKTRKSEMMVRVTSLFRDQTLQLINKLEHTEEVIRYVCVTVGAITHLVCMCVPGQVLIDHSMKVFDKTWESNYANNIFQIAQFFVHTCSWKKFILFLLLLSILCLFTFYFLIFILSPNYHLNL